MHPSFHEFNTFAGLFFGRLNADADCELLLRGALDREENEEFDVTVRLDTQSAYVNPTRREAKVRNLR